MHCDISTHWGTILKKVQFVWKRERHRLRKGQIDFGRPYWGSTTCPHVADRGDIELGYSDEAGFALAYPNRSAWTLVGECHTCDAVHCKRLNVVGALLLLGELFTVKL